MSPWLPVGKEQSFIGRIETEKCLREKSKCIFGQYALDKNIKIIGYLSFISGIQEATRRRFG